MGIGPTKYCIVNNWMPEFERNLMLLINYLPHQKMCLCPPQTPLIGPFLHFPWREIGKEISGRTFRLRTPLFCILYYSQQFQIFL